MFRSPFADGVVILIIILLFVGPKQLPKLSRSLGESARELKSGFAEGMPDEAGKDTTVKSESNE